MPTDWMPLDEPRQRPSRESGSRQLAGGGLPQHRCSDCLYVGNAVRTRAAHDCGPRVPLCRVRTGDSHSKIPNRLWLPSRSAALHIQVPHLQRVHLDELAAGLDRFSDRLRPSLATRRRNRACSCSRRPACAQGKRTESRFLNFLNFRPHNDLRRLFYPLWPRQ